MLMTLRQLSVVSFIVRDGIMVSSDEEERLNSQEVVAGDNGI